MKSIILTFAICISSIVIAQPRWVVSCNSGEPSHRTLNIYDDGRDYHIKLEARSFAPYYSSPVLQTMSSGEFSFKISKDKCSIKDSTMACLSWNDIPVKVRGRKFSGGSIDKILPVRRASFKISQVNKREIQFMSTGPELRNLTHETVSLSLLTRDPINERVGAFVAFSPDRKCRFF